MVGKAEPSGGNATATGPIVGGDQYLLNKDVKTKLSSEVDDLRHNSDLYVRPSWTDANIVFDQLQKVDKL